MAASVVQFTPATIRITTTTPASVIRFTPKAPKPAHNEGGSYSDWSERKKAAHDTYLAARNAAVRERDKATAAAREVYERAERAFAEADRVFLDAWTPYERICEETCLKAYRRFQEEGG